MAKKKHQPPSKVRYAKEHPSLTVHLTEQEYQDITEFAFNNDKSINQVIKEAAGLVQKNWKKYDRIFNDGVEAGYDDALKDFSRNFRCSKCGRSMNMKPELEDELYKWLVDEARKAGWHHSPCKKSTH